VENSQVATNNRSSTAAEVLQPHAKQSLRLWLRLLATTTIVEKAIRAHLKANCDSTLPRFDVLAAMDRTGGKMTMSQLSNRLLVSNGNVTGVVNRLVEDGYVRREVDPSDRRTQFVSLTAAGRQSFRRMAGQHEELVDDIFSEVSDEDMALLLALTTKVSHLVQHKLKPSSVEATTRNDDD
jgi:DNA-binding MarR family transcriptional regulator